MEPTTTNSLAIGETPTKRVRHELKPDSQGFDEVRITTVPRFKSSYLSGGQWRISGKVELMRKGRVVHEEYMGNVENCVKALSWFWMRAGDEGKAFYGGGENGTCDQEGCAEQATVFYRVKTKYCRTDPHNHPKKELDDELNIRQFCERHSKRGDSDFDDMDENYELIDGTIVKPREEDIKKSVLGGVVSLDSDSL
jgi:hypothetical protein